MGNAGFEPGKYGDLPMSHHISSEPPNLLIIVYVKAGNDVMIVLVMEFQAHLFSSPQSTRSDDNLVSCTMYSI